MRVPSTLRGYVREARSAFEHAPIEVSLGLLLAVTFSAAVRQDDGMDWWSRVAATALLAMPLVFAASVLRARRVYPAPRTWLVSAAAVAAAAAYAVWIFDPERSAEVWRCFALALAAVLALALAPLAGGGGRAALRHRLWAFDTALLLRLVGVGAYGALLYAALAGAVAAVSSLFDLRTPEHLYADLAGAVFFALVPWAVAGGVPALATAGEAEAGEGAGQGVGRVVTLFGRFLYVPVLGIYLLILYAYTLEVLVTGEMPRNLLSPIVLFAGLAGFLGSLLLEPLRHSPVGRGVDRLVRVFPLLLLPLLPLAAWAVWVRVAQHGWTEFRYLRLALLAALAVLAVAGTARLVRRRAPLLAAVPATLAAALLLSAVGPWSAPSVSRRDQQARLRQALAEAQRLDAQGGLVLPDTAAAPRPVSRELFDRLTGSATYLHAAHGPESLRALAPGTEPLPHGWEWAQALRLEVGCEQGPARPMLAVLPDSAGVSGLPAGTLYRLRAFERGLATVQHASGGTVGMRIGSAAVEVFGGEGADAWHATVNVTDLVRRTSGREASCGAGGDPNAAHLRPADVVRPLIDRGGRERGVLVLTTVAARWDSIADAPVVQHVEALAVIR